MSETVLGQCEQGNQTSTKLLLGRAPQRGNVGNINIKSSLKQEGIGWNEYWYYSARALNTCWINALVTCSMTRDSFLWMFHDGNAASFRHNLSAGSCTETWKTEQAEMGRHIKSSTSWADFNEGVRRDWGKEGGEVTPGFLWHAEHFTWPGWKNNGGNLLVWRVTQREASRP